jgi:hypothetical protein
MTRSRSETGEEGVAVYSGPLPVSPQGEAALELAANGHPVIPLHTPTAWGCSCGRRNCGRAGKHPRGIY